MKKYIILLGFIILGENARAQAPTIGTSQGQNVIEYWSRAGNTNVNGGNNVFGTKFDSPIYTVTGTGFNVTGTTFRSKINCGYTSLSQYTVNGFTYGTTNTTINTTGYMLLGYNSLLGTGRLYDTKGAFSMLHLNGKTPNEQIQEFGFRPWMKTGVTFTDNKDLSYIGLRKIDESEDFTETTITVADNYGPNGGTVGPDDIVFRFTSGGDAAATIYNTDVRNPYDVDGVHLARFTSYGLLGLGNTFGIQGSATPANLYIKPQSLLHLSYDRQASLISSPHPNGQLNEAFGFMQITYRRPAGATTDIVGEGEQVTDGLRFGIDNEVIQPLAGSTAPALATRHLNAYLRWQEVSSFVIQTEDSKVANIQSNERMRVTSIGAISRHYPGGTFGLYYGLDGNLTDANTLNDSINDNVTRIAISELGSQGLTRPKSLLHLGYDYGNNTVSTPPEGYRKWMDLGMLTSNNRDHIWIGLKPKDSLVQFVSPVNDRLDAVVAWGTDRDTANINNIDNMRFIFTGITAGLPNSPDHNSVPSRKYDGLEMMRMYPATVYQHYLYDTTGTVVDSVQSYGRVGIGDFTVQGVNQAPTHKLDVVGNGRFRYLPDSTFIADSLVFKYVMVDSAGVLRWGGAPFGTPCIDSLGSDFTSDRHVELNGYNFYFSDTSTVDVDNNVGFGWKCGTPLKAKVDAYQNGPGGIGGSFYVDAGTTSYPLGRTGVRGFVVGGPTNLSVGVEGQALTGGSNQNIGVYGRAGGASTNWAGFFQGDVYISGSYGPSDENLKENVTDMENADSLISLLNPVTFDFKVDDYPQLQLQEDNQMGLIAQEVETIFPAIVKNNISPAQYDELGNVIGESVEFKTVDYTKLIPLLIAGHQDQASQMKEKDEIIDSLENEVDDLNEEVEDLNARLTQLENCLSGILPYLCQLSQSAIQANTPAAQEEVRKNLNVTLSSRSTIVLDQNLPNPFAEQTVINFSIPSTVVKAQIHFYDGNGKLIQSVDVTERGAGSITVFGSDLSKGTYTYTLVADGQIVATKKMIKQ